MPPAVAGDGAPTPAQFDCLSGLGHPRWFQTSNGGIETRRKDGLYIRIAPSGAWCISSGTEYRRAKESRTVINRR